MNPNDPLTTQKDPEFEMANLYIGLGSVAYAMAKIDGKIQLEEMQTVKEILANTPHGDLALYAFLLREKNDQTIEEAYDFAMRRFVHDQKLLTISLKKQFVDVLIRIAESHDDTSRKEQGLIKRFRRDLRRL